MKKNIGADSSGNGFDAAPTGDNAPVIKDVDGRKAVVISGDGKVANSYIKLPENLKEIVRILLRNLSSRTNAQMRINLAVSEKAVEYIADKGFDKNYGARPIRRAIQTEIEDLLADKLLAGEVKAGEKVNVDYDETEKKIIISVEQ